MLLLRRLLKSLQPEEATARRRVGFATRWFSQYLVLCPRLYIVLGTVESASESAFLERLKWFYASEEGARFLIRSSRGWQEYRITASRLDRGSKVSFAARAVAVAFGKILLWDYSQKLQTLKRVYLLPYKVFAINWQREYRISSWRFLASLGPCPLRRVSSDYLRPDLRPRSEECVVLGNGPSAQNVFDPRFAGMDIIACNTAIKSDRLLNQRLAALCIVDAVFFWGPNDYASAFQRRLNQVVSGTDFSVYIDCEHERFARQRIHGLSDQRVFPIYFSPKLKYRPHFKGGRFQGDGVSVFTMAMLPLAATYYKRIHLVGFDGKDPNMSTYYWNHSDEFQFTDLLPTVRAAEPGFFKGVDFLAHSDLHAAQVEAVLTEVERAGVDVVMTHPSFIPPLQKRYRQPDGAISPR